MVHNAIRGLEDAVHLYSLCNNYLYINLFVFHANARKSLDSGTFFWN